MNINIGMIIKGTESITRCEKDFQLRPRGSLRQKEKAEELGYRDLAIYRLDPLLNAFWNHAGETSFLSSTNSQS